MLRHNKLHLGLRPGTDAQKRRAIAEAWYRDQVRQALPALFAKWQPILGVEATGFYVQRMRTRWGSCNPTARTIRLNTDLAKKPRDCLEYIVVHELVHMLEPTHNARFVALMNRFMPRWQDYRKALNRLPVRHEEWEYWELYDQPPGTNQNGRSAMAKKKVFVSFDFDNDKTLKDFIIGQAKLDDSPFEVVDLSLKEAAPEKDWLDKARAAINRCDVFIVMLGPKTKCAPGVLKEIKIANELKKTKFQLIGYKDGSDSWAVPDAGRVYSWNWDNLKKLLA